MKYDCIIVGAGATGLMASLELTQAGRRVLLLEARDRVGGRIHTISNKGFSMPVEAGAEFIHGNLPLTMALFHSADIKYQAMKGETYQISDDKLLKHDFFDEDWDALFKALKKVKSDLPFAQFLNERFPQEKYRSLHENIKKFVEGYNAADAKRASTLALREEWTQEDDPIQYRPEGGYTQLANFLLSRSIKQGLEIELKKEVTQIQWAPDGVIVQTGTKESYQGAKVLITVPLGVLQTKQIKIEPAIPAYMNASLDIGFGSVVKFVLEFKDTFWQHDVIRKMPKLKFLFTDAPIPTWWSQLPYTTPVLTGWLGGPKTDNLEEDKELLFNMALDSLTYAFKCTRTFIQQKIVAFYICNWKHDPFSRGAYSYATIQTPSAKKLLNTPIANVVYFAGEGLYEGPHMGTVEAALSSAKDVASRMLVSF